MSWDGNVHGVLIGSKSYPLVNSGLLVNKYDKKFDSYYFLKNKSGFSSIVMTRRSFLNASAKVSVKSGEVFIEKIKEAGLSYNPVRSEINFGGSISLFSKPSELLPHGPMLKLKNFSIVENFKVPGFVDKVVNDDLKAEEGLNLLYKKSYTTEYLSQLLSTSNLGSETERKLVPSRWSVTAVDDIIGKGLKKNVGVDSFSNILFFKNTYLGNDFYIFLFPGSWEFELVEYYRGELLSDYESVFGRKSYAFNTSGGYYAARMGVLEYLKRENISAKVLVVRDITDYYKFSLGVWVVREAVRKTMLVKPLEFENVLKFKKEAKLYISFNLSKVVSELFKTSKVLKSVFYQSSLSAFMKHQK